VAYYIDEIDTNSELREYDEQKFGRGITDFLIKKGELLHLDEQELLHLAKIVKLSLLELFQNMAWCTFNCSGR
jgi:hypothetical protein